MRNRRNRDGFTLVEVLISLLLIGLVFSVTIPLIAEAGVRAGRAAQKTLDTDARAAAALLRADLTSASGAQSGEDGELILVGHPAGTVAYRLDGAELLRETAGGTRVAAIDVADWSWTAILGAEDRLLVEVDFTVQRTRISGGSLTRTSRDLERRTIRLMLRGSGGEGGWW